MRFSQVKSAEELAALVEEIGFLPLFRGEIEGFSVEDVTPPELWFTDEEGPWEWKGPVIRLAKCAYGKFYDGKAMFVSREFFPAFANVRRDGYDFDARMDEGIARGRDIPIMEELWRTPVLLSKELRRRVCFTEERKRSFEGSLTRLQMMGYVNVADFTYARDRFGKEYGWGLAVYTTPEEFFGEEFRTAAYADTPQRSFELLERHLHSVLPQADKSQLARLLSPKGI